MSLPPSEIPLGAMRFNSDSQKLEYWDGSQWVQVHTFSPNLNGGARGLFGGGFQPSPVIEIKSIDYINISSTGNAQDFGDLQQTRQALSSLGSSTRGFWVGGRDAPANFNIIEFVTFSSLGDYTDFGDITAGTRQGPFGLSNATRGIIGGGSFTNTIDYITMSSAGNSVTFGESNPSNNGTYQAALMSPTRGVFNSSLGPSPFPGQSALSYVTIATLGNSQDFGNLQQARASCAGLSNSTRGLFAGGYQPTLHSSIEYFQIASTGNAQFFGDLLATTQSLNGNCTSSTRGVIAGGSTPGYTNTIQYISIQTQGNAVDFGDLTGLTSYPSGISNAHGGL